MSHTRLYIPLLVIGFASPLMFSTRVSLRLVGFGVASVAAFTFWYLEEQDQKKWEKERQRIKNI